LSLAYLIKDSTAHVDEVIPCILLIFRQIIVMDMFDAILKVVQGVLKPTMCHVTHFVPSFASVSKFSSGHEFCNIRRQAAAAASVSYPNLFQIKAASRQCSSDVNFKPLTVVTLRLDDMLELYHAYPVDAPNGNGGIP
jgi:hypothetical protein